VLIVDNTRVRRQAHALLKVRTTGAEVIAVSIARFRGEGFPR
jgi:hypothetical protein